jgi:hypothetical protein
MLPNATTDQRLATAFHRNTLVNNEGGTDNEEFRTIAVKDRLSTTLNGWMGLTVRCAECHSHKYDPISQHEYYQLLDFFNQTADADERDERPKLPVVPVTDQALAAKLAAEIASLQKQVDATPVVWAVHRPSKMNSKHGTKFELQDDDSILATGRNPPREEYEFTIDVPANSTVQAIRLEAIPHLRHDNNTGRGGEGAFILSQVRLVKHAEGKDTPVAFADAECDHHQVNQHPRTAIRAEVKSGAHQQGWAVNHPVDGYKSHREAVFELKEPIVAGDATSFTLFLRHDPPWVGLNMGCVRIATCAKSKAASKYKQKQLDPFRRELQTLQAKQGAPVRVPVMEQLPEKRHRQTFVNLRGNFRSPGDKVTAKFPKAFASKQQLSADRLGLARWLFAEDNPLTARVAVNRYWSRMMGIGLVETEEDFGTQGTPPSHPQLLDFLSADFHDGGWDVKNLLTQIVMSDTYQQSSIASSKALEKDPRNRLLSRGPRIRLSAEVVRDQALAVSGLLSSKVYGPPVFPPSPIKRVVNAFTGGMTWQESTGEDRYRRALYTFYKRSAPHPLFETFDMSSRDICSMRRLRTNTPLQSFMTLNDVTFLEAARALADRMIASQPHDDDDDNESDIAKMITFGRKTALYIDGDEVETRVLTKLYHSSVKRFLADTNAAVEFTGGAKKMNTKNLTDEQRQQLVRRAAMTVVANVILNLDGFLNN